MKKLKRNETKKNGCEKVRGKEAKKLKDSQHILRKFCTFSQNLGELVKIYFPNNTNIIDRTTDLTFWKTGG